MDENLKGSVSIGTWPTPERTIRVSLPGKIAYDLNAFQKAQATILDRLGCTACCSGWDIRFDIIRNFTVDKDLNIQNLASDGVVVTDV